MYIGCPGLHWTWLLNVFVEVNAKRTWIFVKETLKCPVQYCISDRRKIHYNTVQQEYRFKGGVCRAQKALLNPKPFLSTAIRAKRCYVGTFGQWRLKVTPKRNKAHLCPCHDGITINRGNEAFYPWVLKPLVSLCAWAQLAQQGYVHSSRKVVSIRMEPLSL